MLGGLVVVPPGNASLEDMRHVVSRYSRYQFRAFVFHEKLVSLDLPQVASRLNKIFLYDFPPAAVTTQVENGFLVLSSQDLCHGGVLITSMPSNGQRRVVASNCRVSVAAPGNTEPTTQSGVAGQLVIKDGNALAGCVVAHSPSSLEPANHTRHWQRGFLDTGLQACVDSDGALHVHHQVGTREPEVNDEDFLADSVRGYATPSRETTPSEDETPSQKPTVNVQERNTHAADPQLVLARLWADVLCVDQSTLDLDDRFIDRGGDSFKTAQLISLARAEGVELPVLELFTGNLSLQEMAAGITNNRLGRTADSNATCDLDSEAVPKGLSRGMHDDDDVEDDLSNLLGRVPLPEWLHADHVDKVLPATGWQASIAGHMTLEAQHWADCLVFDLHGPLSIDHLRTSCASLLASHEILRTVFAVAGGHALQLVVGASHYPLRFTTQQVDPAKGETLDLVTNEFWSETKRPLPPQLDRQWVRFMVVVQDAHRHRLLVRLTHGQYDAGSIPPIIQHLRFSYEKASCNSRDPLPGLTPHHPQFSSFVAWARRKPYVKAAEGFWEETLRGLGKSTTLLPQPHNGPSAATTGVEHVINERSRSPEISLDLGLLRGVMPSTVISAAWSAVLMFLTGESDVVHGMVTSGRHNAMEGIDRVVGPCWNVLPVRTRLEVSRADEQEEQTVLGLLRQVQRSQQDSLAHELLPFRHMVEKCTTWPPWTNLSSVINFENVAIPRIGGTAAPVSARQRLAPGVELEFTPMAGPVSGPTDFWVAVTPHNRPEGTGVTLELRWDNRKFARGFVDAVLRLYSEVVVVFTVDPAMPVVEAVRRAATSGLGEDGAEELRTSVACKRHCSSLFKE
ncbi:CoA-dependent acyltransferase [Colletotrichum sublineola]|nr:CoA-dependent acyltransferase [Colletotrichum sublineola]